MKTKKAYMNYLLIAFALLSICLIAYVLFKYPQPGVADQGDFDRIMSVSGLQLTNQSKLDPNFHRFYSYVITDYSISKEDILKIVYSKIVCSLAYVIIFINFICKLLNQSIFKTSYLAIAYSIIYISSLYIIIKYINIQKKITLILLASICLFIFFDGNYLVWFNSLYGEPMMITTLLLYICSWIYYIYYKYVIKDEKKILSKIIFIYIASFLFLGSKMQVITALPIIAVMLIKLLWENRYILKYSKLLLLLLFFLIIAYPISINLTSGQISKDTQYNSVFYGVLKDSKNPRQDLIDMNLNPDMAVEAGKHSYLDKKYYVKYVPHGEATEKEFYSKVGNSKLIKFYITHPIRLIHGMEYTANHAFFTGTFLGHYERSYSEDPIKRFNRFTLWSSLKDNLLPKKLSFIILIYVLTLGLTLFNYKKHKKSKAFRAKIELLWSIMLIGLFQFPMPFIGNGQADTSKQLFLFNFIFDIILIVLIYSIIFKLIKTASLHPKDVSLS